jgi:hypothetical protein
MNKNVVISSCSHCPYFDNRYNWGVYYSTCKLLNREIKDNVIPDDCPLEDTNEAVKDLTNITKK